MFKILQSRRVAAFLIVILFTCYGMWKLFGSWFFLAVCAYVVYYSIHHKSELANTRLQDYINPLKWGSVLYATFMKLLFPMHIVHQLILRMYDMECRACVREGSCIHCGCDISKVYTPWDRCSAGNWGPMVEDAEEYRKMREEFPVEITIKYTKEF